MAAILFVLRTGIAWADLLREMGCSYKTCLRRLKEWTAAGVWQRVYLHLLRGLRLAGRLELAEVLVDAGLVKAPLGGQTGPNPTDRGRCGSKYHLMTTRDGIPLAATITGAQVHDVLEVLPLVVGKYPRVGRVRGRPLERPRRGPSELRT